MKHNVKGRERGCAISVSPEWNDKAQGQGYFDPHRSVSREINQPMSRPNLYIREWAKVRGLLQVDVSRELDVSKGLVSNWFSNRVVPEPANQQRLAQLFGLPDVSLLYQHPRDAWLGQFNERRQREMRELFAGRSDDEIDRMLSTLRAAFSRTKGSGD